MLALVVAGCGGSAGSAGSFNLWQGSWTGPWSSAGDRGTATFHINGPGSISGEIVDTTANQVYQVTGQIEDPSLSSTKVAISETNGGATISFTGSLEPWGRQLVQRSVNSGRRRKLAIDQP